MAGRLILCIASKQWTDIPSMLRCAHVIQLAVLGMLGVAVVMVHSAGMTIGSVTDPLTILTSRHALYALLALGAMVLATRINVRQVVRHHGWTNPLLWFVLLSLSLSALVLLPGVGRNINGARRWLQVGPITFQPSELVKWAVVLALAWWCTGRRGAMHRFWDGLVPMLLLLGAACALIVTEDLGTAALISIVGGCVLVAGGARPWHLGLLIPVAAVGFLATILQSPYRMARIKAFLDPWSDPRGIGYHAIQSELAIAQGGIFGRGLGNGIQKFGYVPADTTDFIFAVICEETGLVGATIIAAGYVTLLWVALAIFRRCPDTFGRLVTLGIVLMVCFQALMNIAVVTVVVPTKGIALPLISAGGTGWVMTAFALGLVAALDNANIEEGALDESGERTPSCRALPSATH